MLPFAAGAEPSKGHTQGLNPPAVAAEQAGMALLESQPVKV